MDQRPLAQVGTPVEIYERPNSRWVAGFVGDVNLIEARVTAVYPSFVDARTRRRCACAPPAAAVAPGAGRARAAAGEDPHRPCGARRASRKTARPGASPTSAISATLSIYKVRLDDGLVLKAAVMNEQRDAARAIHVNDRVWLSWAPDAGVVLTD